MVQYDIEITGRVQGVGFRQFTLHKARQLNVTGWVRNTMDGKVQLVAKGNKKDIEIFIDYLKTGPSMARVENVSKYQMQKLDDFTEFKVKG